MLSFLLWWFGKRNMFFISEFYTLWGNWLKVRLIHAVFVPKRLVEETFTVDEVREMLDGLQVVVRGDVEMELINTAHTNVLLLRQLFSQAEKFYLRLQSDISELENRWAAMKEADLDNLLINELIS